MAIKTLSRKGKEPASLWLERIKEFQRFWDEDKEDRNVYRRAVRLDLEPRGKFQARLPEGEMRVHLPHRIHTWFQSQAYDEDPEIRYPRDASGDAGFGPMVEKVVTRVMDDADGVRAFRRGLTDILTDGCFAVFYGLPNEPTAEDAEWVNVAPEDVFEEAIQGQHIARAGQDHLFLTKHLMTMGLDADGMRRFAPEQQMAVFKAAADHAGLAAKEAKKPQDWTVNRGRVWIKHYQVGDHAAWDTTVSSVSEARWMAYRISMHVDRAQSHPSFEPVGRARIMGSTLEHRLTPADGEDIDGQPHEIRTADMDADTIMRENTRANIWIIYDRKHDARHMIPEVTNEGESYYLELTEDNPYADPETGKSVIPNYFPCEVCAPHKSNERSVKRTFGLAGLTAGWPFIISIQNYEAAIDDMIKRIKRVFVFHPSWTKAKRNLVANGPDGTTVTAPAEAVKADPKGGGIYTPTFPDVSSQLLAERDRKLTYLSIVMGIPRSALVGEAVAETLGQEEIAEAGGHSQTVDIVRQIARTWARVSQGVMMLVRTFYDASDVARIIGEDALAPIDPQTGEPTGEPSRWEQWVLSSTEGDQLSARFSATKADENPRRVNQLMQAIKVNREVPDPITGLPTKDDEIAKDEMFRALGVGDLPDLELDPMQQLIMAIQKNPEALAALQGGGQPTGEGRSKAPDAPGSPSSNDDSTGPRTGSSPVQPQHLG